jgi:hypothetical protein
VSKQDSSQIVFPFEFLLILQKTEGCSLYPMILGEKPNWESFLKTKSAILFSESIPFCDGVSTNCLVNFIMSEYNFSILKIEKYFLDSRFSARSCYSVAGGHGNNRGNIITP